MLVWSLLPCKISITLPEYTVLRSLHPQPTHLRCFASYIYRSHLGCTFLQTVEIVAFYTQSSLTTSFTRLEHCTGVFHGRFHWCSSYNYVQVWNWMNEAPQWCNSVIVLQKNVAFSYFSGVDLQAYCLNKTYEGFVWKQLMFNRSELCSDKSQTNVLRKCLVLVRDLV